MNDIFEQVRDRIMGLVEGSMSREEAADWAMAQIKDESANYYSNKKLWRALRQLSGADLKEAPEVYLHDEGDLRSWLAELDE